MDAQESQEKFKQADTLFKAGNYQEALDILAGLNRAFPNAKNILYPAAMCLEKLGRHEEALPLCNQLIRDFQDPRAEKLKAKIERRAGGTGALLDLSDIDRSMAGDLFDTGPSHGGDLLGLPSTTHAYKPVEPDPIPWLKYSLIGLGAACVLALLIVPVLIYEPPPPASEPAAAPGQERVDTTLIYLGALACYLIVVTFQTGGAYLCLMLQRALPHHDFWSNFFNISVSMFLATILEGSLFGIFLTGLWFSKAYDLSFGALVVFYIFRIIFGVVGFFLGFFVFGASLVYVLQGAVPVQ